MHQLISLWSICPFQISFGSLTKSRTFGPEQQHTAVFIGVVDKRRCILCTGAKAKLLEGIAHGMNLGTKEFVNHSLYQLLFFEILGIK